MIVLGGAGFIGSAFVKLSKNPVVIDKLTYAADLRRIPGVEFYRRDICSDFSLIAEKESLIVNFAAETHVDKSIQDPTQFLTTNVLGLSNVLNICIKYNIKYIHISTDEVYGEILEGEAKEDWPLNPSNPYAASKAAGDLLVKSYIRTYGLKAIIIRPCNNYGPYQNEEKFIPNSILNGVSLYGDGSQVREWLYVDDCVKGIFCIINKGEYGQVYNLGSGFLDANLNVAKRIGKITYVKDRPGHDRRYSMDSSKIRGLGWKPKVSFKDGLRKTIKFYLINNKKKCYT